MAEWFRALDLKPAGSNPPPYRYLDLFSVLLLLLCLFLGLVKISLRTSADKKQTLKPLCQFEWVLSKTRMLII